MADYHNEKQQYKNTFMPSADRQNSVVVGGVEGSFAEVFKKLAALHSKNAFAFAIIAGDLFSDPSSVSPDTQTRTGDLLNGKIKIPLPTYFALGRCPLPPEVIQKLDEANGELCENLYFLGKRTSIKTSEGIKIVALGGVLDPGLSVGTSKDNYAPYCSVGDADGLKAVSSADILVTHPWPEHIRKNSKVDFSGSADEAPASHRCVADLCSALRPRYHFSTSGAAFFEREPFFHAHRENPEDGYAITRFISLASFGNPGKQKWIYAFSLDPHAAAPLTVPAGTTASPLPFTPKRRPEPADAGFSRFSTNGHHDTYRPRKRRRQQPPPGPHECFFCLSNPTLAAHLVVSIGSDAYLTTSKGPLSTSKTFPELSFPSHILIIPLAHAPTIASIPEPEASRSTAREMQRYRGALHRMLLGKAGSKLGSVTWEVSRAGGIHAHWQFLPMPADMIRRGLVGAAFKVEAENEKYPAFRPLRSEDDAEDEGDCFKVWIWEPPGAASVGEENDEVKSSVTGRETRMVLPLDPSFRFDLQMGRRVLGKLLGLEGRTHWRDCDQTQQEEVAEADAFKEAFKEHDFSLEG